MSGSRTTAIVCLHFLGGSARSWDGVAAALGAGISCVALDLPGFGDANGQPGANVAGMADVVAESIRRAAPQRWWMVGHSMGAKVALTLARRAEAGDPHLYGLDGIALLAGSPPAPEPMDEYQRNDMVRWIDGSDDLRRDKARAYIRENLGDARDSVILDRAAADVLRTNREAWKMWLTAGSREDCRAAIGLLTTPTLIMSGTEDRALGPEAQERLMVPHLQRHRHIILEGAGHLLPIERPSLVAKHLCDAMAPENDV